MSNVNLYSPDSSFLLNLPDYPSSIDLNSLDYKAMHENDILFDSLDIDLSLFSHPLLEKPISEKKTWSDVIGHEHMREPIHTLFALWEVPKGMGIHMRQLNY